MARVRSTWFLERSPFEATRFFGVVSKRSQEKKHVSFEVGLSNWFDLKQGKASAESLRNGLAGSAVA